MTDSRQRMKRVDIAPSSGINGLINAANTNDRFKLLEDDDILPANLTNEVHPIFHQLCPERQLQQMLQLASQYLLHDRLLEFFVPLLFGRELTGLQSSKTFLSDPLTDASKTDKAQHIANVREALLCLAHRIEICFVKPKKQVYARTIANDVTSKFTSNCCRAFQGKVSPKIEISNKFIKYYHDVDGYTISSRCAQYRHDFLFATTLVHEVVHAVGVMRRGHLVEPHYRHDFPETEWGYAWENFMFGNVINPQDRTKPGTHLLMRKVWVDAKVADANGGKEYCNVSMSWIAQWFRRETWDIIAKQGSCAIPPPITHFKIQVSHKLGAWVVSSDSPDVQKDIIVLYRQWVKYSTQLMTEEPAPEGRKASHKIYYNTRTTAQLQMSNVSAPLRERKQAYQPCIIQQVLSAAKDNNSTEKPLFEVESSPIQTTASLIAVCRASSPYNIRKRRADAHDSYDQLRKTMKRSRRDP
jgi:hypothetical protein